MLFFYNLIHTPIAGRNEAVPESNIETIENTIHAASSISLYLNVHSSFKHNLYDTNGGNTNHKMDG